MRERSVAKQLRVGVLILAALATVMLALLSVGQEQRFWERRVSYEIHFTRTNGLQVGAPVALTGVTVGSVGSMRFPADPTARFIRVKVSVAGNVAPRVRENSVASIRTLGLLGDKYIEISAGTPDAAPLPPGGVIASIDPIDYEAVLGQSGDIVSNVVELTASLRNLLKAMDRGQGLLGALVKNRELGEATLVDFQRTMRNLRETTTSLQAILARIERGEGLLGMLARNTERGREIKEHLARSAANLEEVSRRLARSPLLRALDDEQYTRRVLANLDRATADLAEVAAKLNRGEGTLGKLLNDPALYHQAESLLGTARKSWALRLYRGLSGLWPFGHGEPEQPAEATSPGAAPGR